MQRPGAIRPASISRRAKSLTGRGAQAVLPDVTANTVSADKAFGAAERVLEALQQAGKRR